MGAGAPEKEAAGQGQQWLMPQWMLSFYPGYVDLQADAAGCTDK